MRITIEVNCPQAERILQEFECVKAALARIEGKENIIIMDEQQVKDALAKIDAATTKIGTNVATIATNTQQEADVIQTINDDVDKLIAGMQQAGVSQALIDQANAVATATQASSDALDAQVAALQAQVPVLQAIATKGAVTPVPVPVPPAPTS